MRKASMLIMILACLGLLLAACGDDSEKSSSAATTTVGSNDGADSTGATTAPSEAGETSSGPSTTVRSEVAGDADSPAEDGTFPVSIKAGDSTLTIEAKPEAIVSLSPTATEMLFAIGAGAQVVAVDDNSNYPTSAPKTDLSGYEPNVEAVLGYEPDLVVASAGTIAAGLKVAGVPLLVLPAAVDFDQMYEQIEQLGVATGQVGGAAELVGNMQTEIKDILAGVPEGTGALTYYHELDSALYTVTSDTFIGQVYELLGLENIADSADPSGEFGGYPQISAELILDQNPDLIFLADTKCCEESAKTVSERDGWEDLTAVKDGNVIALDDDVASRWGPRVVEFLSDVATAVTAVEAPAAAR